LCRSPGFIGWLRTTRLEALVEDRFRRFLPPTGSALQIELGSQLNLT
jgi:hypothetical protein